MTTKQALNDIEDEICHYQVPAGAAKTMRALIKLGFRWSGHGTSLLDGGEDFSFVKDHGPNDYVDFGISLSRPNKCRASVAIVDNTLFNTVVSDVTVGRALSFIAKHQLLTKKGFAKLMAKYKQ